MRLLAFIAAIAVLFCLNQANAAETAYYSGVAPAGYTTSAAAPTARAAGLRLLTWPGKVGEAPRLREQPPAPASAAVRRAWNPYTAEVQPASPARAPAPAPAQVYAPQPQAALPASIYAAPPPPARQPEPAPVQQARAAPAMTQASSPSEGDYQPPHFYSLYREYGQQPDPIPSSEYDPKTGSVPLNAQFFAASTPDMANPPPPVPQTMTTSGGRVVQTVPPSPDDNPG